MASNIQFSGTMDNLSGFTSAPAWQGEQQGGWGQQPALSTGHCECARFCV